MRGGEALRRQLDVKASAIQAQTGAKGWHAQLRYLTRSQVGRDAMTRVYSPRTLVAWLAEDRAPTRANQAAIQRAYNTRRKPAVAEALKRILNNDGNGTRVEVHPEESIWTDHLDVQTIEITEWDDIIDAWSDGDYDDMNEIWEGIADDDLYPPGGYYHVSHLGF